MSRETVFAHESTEPGMEAPWGRALQFGYRYQTVAENLALHPRFAFNEQPFYVTGTCTFKSTTGDVIAPSTYAQLAHEVGVGWMNSPPHRANILLDVITEAGVGISIDYNAQHCGKIYITMLYGKPAQ